MIKIRANNEAPKLPERAVGTTVKVYIQDVVIKDRYRKDMGDLDPLIGSIKTHGLLQPIGITKDNVLVFGERRLTACMVLNWAEIDAKIVDVKSIVEGEFAENEMRKQFTLSERLAIAEAIKRLIGDRQGQRTDLIDFAAKKKHKLKVVSPEQPEAQAELPANRREVAAGQETADEAAKKAGFSSTQQMRRTAKVVEDGAPELVEALDNGQIAVSKAADLVNLTKPEQVVALDGAKAAKEERDEAARALRAEIEHFIQVEGANAYTDYVLKHGKRPDKQTAADLGRLINGRVKADDGSWQPVKSTAEKAADKERRTLDKEEKPLRLQAYRAYMSVLYLGQNSDDPADLVHLIDRWEIPHMITHFENAEKWFNRFAKEWRRYAAENNIK